jgi:hypothetical protein
VYEAIHADTDFEVDDRHLNALLQLLLPARLGGAGIVPTHRIAPAAFVGSFASCAAKCVHFYGREPNGASTLALRASMVSVADDEAKAAGDGDGEDGAAKGKKKRTKRNVGKAQNYWPSGISTLIQQPVGRRA